MAVHSAPAAGRRPDAGSGATRDQGGYGQKDTQIGNYVSAPGATAAFEDLLPVRIDEAEVEGPTLMLRGDGWSLAATCEWRWSEPGERTITDSDPDAPDAVWELVGRRVVAVEWVRTAHGTDPVITLDGGLNLQIRSDAAFDTWTIHTTDLVLVGPLPDEVDA